jgi:hypothetical protein
MGKSIEEKAREDAHQVKKPNPNLSGKEKNTNKKDLLIKRKVIQTLLQYVERTKDIEDFFESDGLHIGKKEIKRIIQKIFINYNSQSEYSERQKLKARFYVDKNKVVEVDDREDIMHFLCLLFEEKIEHFRVQTKNNGTIDITKGFASGLKVKIDINDNCIHSVNIGISIHDLTEDIIKYIENGSTETLKFKEKNIKHATRYYIYKLVMILCMPVAFVFGIGILIYVPIYVLNFLFEDLHTISNAKEVMSRPIESFPQLSAILGVGMSLFHYAGSKYEKEINKLIAYRKLGIDDQFTTYKKGFLAGIWISIASIAYLVLQ